MKIYLAGAMTGLTIKEMNGWRLDAMNFLSCYNIKVINPTEYYNFEINPNSFTDKECMKFDLTAVRNSDLILVNLNKNSIGTAIELFEANKSNIPVVGFNEDRNTHPWIRECIDTICGNLYEAMNYIESHYAKILN